MCAGLCEMHQEGPSGAAAYQPTHPEMNSISYCRVSGPLSVDHDLAGIALFWSLVRVCPSSGDDRSLSSRAIDPGQVPCVPGQSRAVACHQHCRAFCNCRRSARCHVQHCRESVPTGRACLRNKRSLTLSRFTMAPTSGSCWRGFSTEPYLVGTLNTKYSLFVSAFTV